MKLQKMQWGRVSSVLALLLALVVMLGACSTPAHKDEENQANKSSAAITEVESEASATETDKSHTEQTPLQLGALKGPTSMGMAYVFDSAKEKANELSYRILGSPEEIVPLVVKKELDVAAVPANLAAVLYAKTKGAIQVLNINTLGVLYLVEQGESVHSIADLRGKTVLASGKGATPEYALTYLLKANGLTPEDVTMEWKSEHAEVVAALAEQKDAVALLPEPFVSAAETKLPALRRAVDLTAAWDAAQSTSASPSALVMGVLVARKEAVEAHPEAIAALLEEVSRSVETVRKDPAAAAKIIGELGIVPEPVAQKAIPHANLVSIVGTEMKEKLGGYLRVLAEQNPKVIGGALPADDFYFLPEGQH